MNNETTISPPNVLVVPTLSQIKSVMKEAIREELSLAKAQENTQNERLYNKKEAAEYLRISVSKLDGLRREKKFGKRIGAKVLFTKEELDGLLV